MTQHLPARPIGGGDAIFSRADSTVLKPAECYFRAHDANVTTRLNLVGCQPTRFNVDLGRDTFDDGHAGRTPLRSPASKSRRWVNAVTSRREAT
jgi:hypothetical protein